MRFLERRSPTLRGGANSRPHCISASIPSCDFENRFVFEITSKKKKKKSHFLQNFHPIFPLSSGSVLFGKKKQLFNNSYRLVAAWLMSDVKQTAAAWVSSKNRNRKWPRCHAWGANRVGWCHCCSDPLTTRSQGIRKMSLNCHTGAPMSQPRTENLRRRFNKTDKHMTSFKPVRVWVSERKGECVCVSVWEGIWVCQVWFKWPSFDRLCSGDLCFPCATYANSFTWPVLLVGFYLVEVQAWSEWGEGAQSSESESDSPSAM